MMTEPANGESRNAVRNGYNINEKRVTEEQFRGKSMSSVKRVSAWLLTLPILYKVLIANAVIVAVGAVIGTRVTIIMTRAAATQTQLIMMALAFMMIGGIASVLVNYLVLRAAFQPLEALERTATAVRLGDLSVRAQPTRFRDAQFAHLATTFNSTLDELVRDRQELRGLASQVIRAQELERKRISRELHDDTAQILFAQLLRVTAVRDSGNGDVKDMASALEEMTVQALESVRRLALELRPPALDDLGLHAALADLAQRFSEQLGIPVSFDTRGPRGRLVAEVELVLYRVAQEALTNAAKHAGATQIWVDLDRGSDDVTISIRDDGGGFDPNHPAEPDERGLGLGIFGMEERVALVGGTFRIWQRPGGGTEVFAFIPLTDAAAPTSRTPISA